MVSTCASIYPYMHVSGEAFFTIHDHTTVLHTFSHPTYQSHCHIYMYAIRSLPLVNWPIFIINVYAPSLKRISLSHLSFAIRFSFSTRICVRFFLYIRFRTRIFFSFASTLQYSGSDIVPRSGGVGDGGFGRRRVYRGYSKATAAVVGVVCARGVLLPYSTTDIYIYRGAHIWDPPYTHTHTLVVESFGTYSKGDVCVCRSAGNGTLTYYTTPRTNPLATVDTLVTPSTAEHTRAVYTACRSKNGRPPPIPTHPRLNLSACLVLVILTRAHTPTRTHTHT